MYYLINNYSYFILICGLIAITALFAYHRNDRAMYMAAPIIFVGGLVLIGISVLRKDINDVESIATYFMMNKNKPNRLYISGYLMIWYGFLATFLYPFYKNKLKKR